jgi:hypothetical protein
MVTVSAELLTVPSFTVKENTSTASASPTAKVGAVKVGCAAVVLESVTDVPDVCDHV